jgi:1-phosphofructokinase
MSGPGLHHTESPRSTSREVAVLDPAPRLSIHLHGELDATSEVHLHAGGQGIWIARMARLLGAGTRICGPFGGESGVVVRALLDGEGIAVDEVAASGANGVSVHAGLEGDPDTVLTRTPSPELDRHELDTLYSTLLAAALHSGVCVLAGVAEDSVLPADTFRRLAADLRASGVVVLADLAGDQLLAAADGGVDLLKVSEEDLLGSDGAPLDEIRAKVLDLRSRGAQDVVVSRASEGGYAVIDGGEYLVRGPRLEVVNPRGAGDAMTGALAAGLANGHDKIDAVRTAVAAGALNVTRHGMATGERSTIERLVDRVTVEVA